MHLVLLVGLDLMIVVLFGGFGAGLGLLAVVFWWFGAGLALVLCGCLRFRFAVWCGMDSG